MSKKICVYCGKTFTPSHGLRKTCCDKCKREYTKIQPSRLVALKHFESMNCAYCGIEFTPKYPNQKCCCEKHGDLFYKSTPTGKEASKLRHKKERALRTIKEREAREKIACAVCGTMFTPTITNRIHCGKEKCKAIIKKNDYQKWHPKAKPTTRICERCGDEFSSVGNRKYCDKHCADSTQSQKRRKKVRAVIHVPYSKREIFLRDEFICYLCGALVDMNSEWPMPYSPSIDHVIPIKHNGADAPDNVKTAHLICNLKKSARLLQ